MIEEGMNLEKLRGPARKALRAGDIFAYRLKGLDYGFGRVIRVGTAYGDATYVLYFYRPLSPTKEQIPVLARDNLLAPPTITGRWLWNSGHFETIAHTPLTTEDVHPIHCFECPMGLGYRDELGKELRKRTQPIGRYVCSLDGAIDNILSEARGIPIVKRLDPISHARHYEAERRAKMRGKPRRRAEVLINIARTKKPDDLSQLVYDIEDQLEPLVQAGRLGRWDGHLIALDLSGAEIAYSGKDGEPLADAILAAIRKRKPPRGSNVIVLNRDGSERTIEL